MSRPWARPAPVPNPPIVDVRIPTLAEVVKRSTATRGSRAGRI